jgi:multidrug resistance efflux pump
MERKPLFTSTILFLLLLVLGASAQQTGENAPSKFTNKDLENYQTPAESDRGEETSSGNGQTKKELSTVGKKKAKDEHDKKYWCTRGSYYRKKVDRARDGLTKAEKAFSKKEQDYHTGKIGSAAYDKAQKNLEKARLDLTQAEKNLNDVENEAYRQWIPPGWLRCQFE